jgi:hypothetical protein
MGLFQLPIWLRGPKSANGVILLWLDHQILFRVCMNGQEEKREEYYKGKEIKGKLDKKKEYYKGEEVKGEK